MRDTFTRSRKALAAATALVAAALGLLVARSVDSPRDPVPRVDGPPAPESPGLAPGTAVGVSWASRPRSFEEMAREATSVADATVVEVRPGPDIVAEVPEHPGGVERIPRPMTR